MSNASWSYTLMCVTAALMMVVFVPTACNSDNVDPKVRESMNQMLEERVDSVLAATRPYRLTVVEKKSWRPNFCWYRASRAGMDTDETGEVMFVDSIGKFDIGDTITFRLR